MKLVFSHWSRPRAMTVDHRIIFALSVLLARKHYDNIELVTDSPGASLVDKMGLPFDSVRVELDNFDVSPMAWAAGKLKAYSLQTQPFVHIDQDVFLFQRLPASIESAPIFVQSREPHRLYIRNLEATPPEMVAALALPPDRWAAYNVGVLGGTDVEFLVDYSLRALDMIKKTPAFNPLSMTVYEQAFLAKAAADAGKPVAVLLDDYEGQAETAESLGYCHLMCAKTRPECIAKIRNRLHDMNQPIFEKAVLSRG